MQQGPGADIKNGLVADELAVAAHWLLGRLSIVQATIARIDRDPDGNPEIRDVLLARSRAALSDIQSALEDLSRGVLPLSPLLHGNPPQDPNTTV